MDELRRTNRAVQGASTTSVFSYFFAEKALKDSRLLRFLAQVTSFIVPILALSFIFDAFLSWQRLATAKNKTLFKLSNAIFSSLIAFFALTFFMSLFFTDPQAALTLQAFSAFCGLGLGVIQGFGSLVTSLTQLLKAPPHSPEQQALKQQALQSLLQFVFVYAAFKSILFFNLPLYLGAMALFSGARLTWHFLGDDTKQWITLSIGISSDNPPAPLIRPTPQPEVPRNPLLEQSHYHSLFQRTFRVDVVRHYLNGGAPMQALAYLQDELTKKAKTLTNQLRFHKQDQKLEAVTQCLALLETPESHQGRAIDTIIQKHPLVCQSFFSKVSDTEDLLLAAKHYLDCDKDFAVINRPAF